MVELFLEFLPIDQGVRAVQNSHEAHSPHQLPHLMRDELFLPPRLSNSVYLRLTVVYEKLFWTKELGTGGGRINQQVRLTSVAVAAS